MTLRDLGNPSGRLSTQLRKQIPRWKVSEYQNPCHAISEFSNSVLAPEFSTRSQESEDKLSAVTDPDPQMKQLPL
jgi:hypothetical protein